jgi:hypothetical protein
MSVAGISSFDFSSAAASTQLTRRQQQDNIGRQLEEALKNGDLAGAEKAFQQLNASGASSTGFLNNPTLRAEFSAVGQDIQNGNLAQAQTDMQTFSTQLLHNDAQNAIRQFKSGDTAAFQQALATLKGDYWAVYGEMPTKSDLRSLVDPGSSTALPSSTGINIQA